MIAILDYGSGNIRSAQRACEKTGADVVVTSDFKTALAADGLIIPGVGAFGACMKGLRAVKGEELIKERLDLGRKILGICVGMQVLFAESDEFLNGERISGVGIFPQRVEKISAPVLPHIGWSEIESKSNSGSFAELDGERFYFVHSYAVKSQVSGATNIGCNYGENFIAAIETDLITATQFHPEKSGVAGLKLIANWAASL